MMSNTTVNQALRILKEHSPKEVAVKIGYKSAGTLYGIRSGKLQIGEKLAVKIVEAYGGKVAKQEKPVKPSRAYQEKKERQKTGEPKKGWHNPQQPPGLTPQQQQAKQDMAKLAEEANALLCRMGMAGVARAAIAKVIEDEVAPALKEMLAKVIGEVRTEGFTISLPRPENPDALAKRLNEIIERAPRGGHTVAVSKDEAGETKAAVDGKTAHDGGLVVEDGDGVRVVPLGEVSFVDGLPPIPDGIQPGPSTLREVNEGLDRRRRWWRRSKK
jgi:Holliday junction resolvasome RuvABC DNA-binding subunit